MNEKNENLGEENMKTNFFTLKKIMGMALVMVLSLSFLTACGNDIKNENTSVSTDSTNNNNADNTNKVDNNEPGSNVAINHPPW